MNYDAVHVATGNEGDTQQNNFQAILDSGWSVHRLCTFPAQFWNEKLNSPATFLVKPHWESVPFAKFHRFF